MAAVFAVVVGALATPASAAAALSISSAPTDPTASGTPAFAGAGALPDSPMTVVLAPVGSGVDPPDLPVTSGATGDWAVAVAAPGLPDGTYTATATQAGNDPSTPVQFRVDTTAPALTVTQPAAITAKLTPTLGGAAGAAPGDSSSVLVEVRAGPDGQGALVRSQNVISAGAAWTDMSPLLTPGEYSVRATQADSLGHVAQTAWRNFTVVVADFKVAPDQVLVGGTVTLTALTAGVKYRWDLDDDGKFDDGTAQQVSRNVTSTSPQRVGLKIVAPDDTTSVATRWITPGNRAPIADFDVSPPSPAVGEAVTLTSRSSDPDGAPLASEAWDLDGDGQFDEASGGVVSISFAVAGTYRIGLRVVDQAGASREATKFVTVSAPTPPGGGDGGSGSNTPVNAPPAPTIAVWPVGGAPSPMLSPFPIVRIVGEATGRGVRLRLVSVAAPKGAVVRARCAGMGCPRRIAALRVAKASRLRIRGLERRELRPGTLVEIFVTAKGHIGKYTRFVVRRRKAPKRDDRCLALNGRSPITCPVG
jgi:hypothetical protein